MFWGLSLKANKKYSQKVAKAFHVSQAALDIANSGDEPVQAILTWEGNNYILCTLRKDRTEQVPLDLNFAEGDEISFTSQGKGNIHLVGYFIVDADDFGGELPSDSDAEAESGEEDVTEDESDEEEEEEEEEPDEPPKKLHVEKEKKITSDGEANRKRKGSSDIAGTPKKASLEKVPHENGTANIKEKKQKNQEKSSETRLQGGVRVEDVLVGSGKEAKPGKRVQVYYEGRFESNNKVFDSTKQGAGFKFILGRGEVIKGWDVGVTGMKVGGKRKIVCPPNMAYGPKGSPPVIPPNSTLVFDVELRGVQ